MKCAAGPERKARERRQARVASLVWGLLFMAVGVLLAMENAGAIDLLARQRAHDAGHAVDGDPDTRWSSEFSDDQWLEVDLGAPVELSRVRLVWEAAYAKAYELQASGDGSSWTALAEVTEGDGGVDEHDVEATARYVRMKGVERATPYGYSLWELEVYGPGSEPDAGETLLSRGREATASSRERVEVFFWSYWRIYWPVLLLVAGLPALLAPKDGGDQVVGLLMVATGAVLQARNLGYVSWGFREIVPVVVALAGLLLVVQSLAQAVRGGARDGDGGEASRTP